MKKKVVAYFSASGVTRGVAERLAEAAGADLFAIEPVQPYTDEDLDWTNKRSRSTVEMNDRSSRPAMKGTLPGPEQYDLIFIGFPIWWGREPSIIDTFVESLDFKGKTIVPFATSGGSGLGDTSTYLEELAPGSEVACGQCFSHLVSDADLKKFADQY